MTIKEKLKYIHLNWLLYVFLIPGLIYFILFRLWPIFEMKLAFQDYRIIEDNVWAGLKNFRVLFSSSAFMNVLRNTIIISSMKIFFVFPIPILLSFLLQSNPFVRLKKAVQSFVYLPHFLSWVVIAGIWINLLSPSTGGVNQILTFFHFPAVDFMTSKGAIRWVLVFSEMWRSAGWDCIIYLAAMMKISPALYEAAYMDGASSWQQTFHITLPQLRNTIITVFILNLGFFMNAGFDQVFNLMNNSVISVVDILDTYVYRIGLQNGQYAIATAASLFKGLIGMVLILGTHFASKKITGKGVW